VHPPVTHCHPGRPFPQSKVVVQTVPNDPRFPLTNQTRVSLGALPPVMLPGIRGLWSRVESLDRNQ
jgi:hypothetical protein